jgi:hypothetical protein
VRGERRSRRGASEALADGVVETCLSDSYVCTCGSCQTRIPVHAVACARAFRESSAGGQPSCRDRALWRLTGSQHGACGHLVGGSVRPTRLAPRPRAAKSAPCWATRPARRDVCRGSVNATAASRLRGPEPGPSRESPKPQKSGKAGNFGSGRQSPRLAPRPAQFPLETADCFGPLVSFKIVWATGAEPAAASAPTGASRASPLPGLPLRRWLALAVCLLLAYAGASIHCGGLLRYRLRSISRGDRLLAAATNNGGLELSCGRLKVLAADERNERWISRRPKLVRRV